MRPLVAAFLCCLVAPLSSASGEQAFPYHAYVTVDGVYVRSGPGRNYYPTDRLKRGQQVEVYRHDPGGWCAIKPVDGSFTWVSARLLKPIDDKLAVAKEDEVLARVGSRFSDIREVVQVRLRNGEVVEVLDSPSDDPWNEGAWLKIAPPAGEFRWVSAKHLKAGSSAMAGESLPAGSPRPRSLTTEEFQAELEGIELKLTTMVIEEWTVWSFDSLRWRTNMLLEQSQTAAERGRARQLTDKIARFDDIKQRQDEVLAACEQTDRTGHLRSKDVDFEESAADLEIDGRFDGVGRLTEVTSAKLGAPRYALLDRSGGVRCYVTPAPGVSLQGYIGRQVGVTGTRGYMPAERAGHVMARHVTPLEGRILR